MKKSIIFAMIYVMFLIGFAKSDTWSETCWRRLTHTKTFNGCSYSVGATCGTLNENYGYKMKYDWGMQGPFIYMFKYPCSCDASVFPARAKGHDKMWGEEPYDCTCYGGTYFGTELFSAPGICTNDVIADIYAEFSGGADFTGYIDTNAFATVTDAARCQNCSALSGRFCTLQLPACSKC